MDSAAHASAGGGSASDGRAAPTDTAVSGASGVAGVAGASGGVVARRAFPGPRKMYRNPRRGILGGVSAGVAEYFGFGPTTARIAFVVLAMLGFFGVMLYAGLWLVLPARPRTPELSPEELKKERRTGYWWVFGGIIAAVVAGSMAVSALFMVAVPLVVVAAGAAVVWQAFDSAGAATEDGDSSSGSVLSRLRGDRFALFRLGGGVVLVVLGLAVILFREVNLAEMGSAVLAVLVTLGGIALLTVPLWMRMIRTVESERAEKARERERANIASHLHDSVLQTLALIQKRSGDSAEVTRLARRQERELRQWLFEAGERRRNDPTSVAAGVERVCEEIEDNYGLAVSQVVVGGDIPFGEHEEAALAAAREALVNVAKHAEVEHADVYCEILDDGVVELFVRDRGVGFDPGAVPEDRKGLALSIRERVESYGGSVRVRSRIGNGTEIAIRMPRSAPNGAAV
ncbi:ATP-binding protein [Dietzia sp.]|uniref:ATP-binding protein n=1 Tax=Dietzia sp. TaxID=1871616 RepID=UPI002FD960C8